MATERRPAVEPVATPIDPAAVQADDALLDMLGGAGATPADTDAELARVLMAWRSDVATEPIPELVSTDAALKAIATSLRWWGRLCRTIRRAVTW